MRALRLSLALFALFITTFGIADAQTEPLRIGGTLPGEIAWSPDGAHLLVAASDVTRLYRMGEWDAPLRTFPAALKAKWINMRVVELDGQRYEVRTGRAVETPDAVPQNPTKPIYNRLDYPSERYQYDSQASWDEYSLILRLQDKLNPTSEASELFINERGNLILVLFSPDESRMAILYEEYRGAHLHLQLWDIQTGRLLLETNEAPSSRFQEVRFSVDSRTLLAIETAVYGIGTLDTLTRISLWDTTTVERQFTDYGYWATPVMSPNKEWFAYAAGNTTVPNELVVWNGNNLIYTEMNDPSDIRFNADGSLLFAKRGDFGIGVIQLDFERRTYSWVGTAEERPIRYAFSPDGRVMLVENTDNALALWHTLVMQEIETLDTKQPLEDVRFGPDGTLIAIGSQTFWDVETGDQLYGFSTPVEIALDWSQVAYWDGGELVLLNLTNDAELRQALVEPKIGTAIAIDPLERWALFRDEDALVAYSLTTAEETWTLHGLALDGRVVFTSDGSYLAIENDRQLGKWTLYKTGNISIPQWNSTIENVHDLILSPDGHAYVTYDTSDNYASYIELYSSHTSHQLARSSFDKRFGIFQSVTHHPAEPWIAVDVVDGDSRVLYLLDTDRMDALGLVVRLIIPTNHSVPLLTRFSPAGKWIIASCGETCISLVNLRVITAGALIGPSPYEYDASAVAFDAGEMSALFKSNVTEEAFIVNIERHTRDSFRVPATGDAIALNADGTRAATVTADGIALWDVSAVRAGDVTPLAVYPITGLAPTQLTFDTDDRLIALEPSGVTVYALPSSQTP
jgi:WD40 repeat protein